MKNFLKFTWTKLLVTLVSITVLCTSAMYVTKKPTPSKETYDKFLYDAGFKNVSSINHTIVNEERSAWEQKGFHFFTYSEMDKLMADNGFIIASADKYKEDIPEAKKKEISEKYKSLKDDILSYQVRARYPTLDGQGSFMVSENEVSSCWSVSNVDLHVKNNDMLIQANLPTDCSDIAVIPSNAYKTIFVVAHASKFLPGTTNDPGKIEAKPLPDPIAVVKHRNGYVVLASW